MFWHLAWWEKLAFVVFSPLAGLMWLGDKVEDRLGYFLDNWLPHFRLRIRKDSRLGRLILKATGYEEPTFCETFWSTVVLPFRARLLRWLWVFVGLVCAVWCLLAVFGVGYAFYDGVRTQGLGPTLAMSGLAVGALVFFALAVGILLAAAQFAAKHLCPVKFEVGDNGEEASA